MKLSKYHIVLDLDNTLISAIHKFYVKVPDYKHSFMYKDFYVSTRPKLNLFMRYLFENFHVHLFTAASKEYANYILVNSGVDISKFEKMLYFEDCDLIKMGLRTHKIKDLTKIHSDLSEIILVDDNPFSAYKQFNNLYKISPFLSYAQTKDNGLLKFIEKFFEYEKSGINDIRKYNWI